jgi:glycosyltransferase involved in cell wall biosynthesis
MASEWDSVVVHPPIDASQYRLPVDWCQAEAQHRPYVTLVNLWNGTGETGKGAHILYGLAKEMPDVNFMGVVGGYGHQDVREVSNVHIQPHTSDILKDVYARTRVLLMPSKYESFGRVAIEGAASGIPTIANPTEGLMEALGPGGLFCPLEDLNAWKRTLRCLLDNPATYREESTYALERSAYWESRRPQELADFVSAVNRLVKR